MRDGTSQLHFSKKLKLISQTAGITDSQQGYIISIIERIIE